MSLFRLFLSICTYLNKYLVTHYDLLSIGSFSLKCQEALHCDSDENRCSRNVLKVWFCIKVVVVLRVIHGNSESVVFEGHDSDP